MTSPLAISVGDPTSRFACSCPFKECFLFQGVRNRLQVLLENQSRELISFYPPPEIIKKPMMILGAEEVN